MHAQIEVYTIFKIRNMNKKGRVDGRGKKGEVINLTFTFTIGHKASTYL